jgi:hypothetical protein
MIRYKLTPEEMDLVREINRERQENKREYNVTSQKVDDSQREDEVSLVGIMGEVATAHEFGMDVNRTVDPSGDNGWDVRKGSVTAEVKTRRGEELDYAMYDAHSDVDADLAILAWQQGKLLTIAGWLSRAEWIMLAEPLQFGRRVRRGVRWQLMRNPAVLHRLLNRYDPL